MKFAMGFIATLEMQESEETLEAVFWQDFPLKSMIICPFALFIHMYISCKINTAILL